MDIARAEPNQIGIGAMLRPRSVAVLGASADQSKPGGRTVANLLRSRTKRKVFPIHPSRKEVLGLKCYSSVSALPETPDLVIVAIPMEGVIDAVRECGEVGVKQVIIFTAGFAETGDRDSQNELIAVAARYGIRILGPNCAGMFHIAERSAFCFSPYFEPDTWRPGGFAILVQGGGLGAAVWDGQDRGVGFSWFVTLGNESDVDVSDLIDEISKEDETKVIGLILEGVKKGDAFRRAVRVAQARGKVLVAMHQGRTEAGRAAAALHTGVLASSEAVNAAVLRELGVPRATDLDELYNLGAMLARFGSPQGSGVAIVSTSGGAGTLCADLASYYGLDVAQPSEQTKAALRELFVAYASTSNPLDITTAIYRDPTLFHKAIKLVVADPAYAAVVVPMPVYYPGLMEAQCIQIMQAAKESNKPVIVAWMSQGVDKPPRQMLERAGVQVVTGADLCMRVLAKYTSYAPGNEEAPAPSGRPPAALGAAEGGILQEHVVKPLLATYGLAAPRDELVRSRDELKSALAKLSTPIVMKVISNDVVHKVAVGGVRLNVSTLADVETAYDAILANVAAAMPQAIIEGVLLQEMVEGFEIVLGAKVDATWGPTVMVGLGGNLTEAIGDIALHTAPLSPESARELLKSTRAYDGMSKLGYHEHDELVQAIVGLSHFIADNRETVSAVDCNPLLVHKSGRARLVDAVIELKKPSS